MTGRAPMRFADALIATGLCLTLISCDKLRDQGTDATPSPDVADLTDAPRAAEDAGPSGSTDASDPAEVVATPDAGGEVTPTDPWKLTVTCEDSADDVYAASIVNVDASAPLGAVVACRQDPLLSAEDVAADAAEDGVETVAAIQPYRIAYVTERSAGVAGLGTARVLVPDPLPEAPVHVVVVTHGTTGLADHCAPSAYPQVLLEMGLPFAGNDMVVVAPDYAGLGNEGTQGYGESHDTARSVLDALRATHALFSPGTLTDDYAVLGHSQGGGAALYTQGLAATYAGDYAAKAVVTFSPGWTPDDEPDRAPYAFPQFIPVTLGAGVSTAAMVLALYADVTNHVAAETAGLFFHMDWRETLVDWIETVCVFALAAHLEALGSDVTLADILAPEFLAGTLACLDAEPTCAEPYASFVERQRGDYIPPDPQGAPLLYVQGMADIQATPKRSACYLDAMAAVGVTPQVCVDPEATHFDVVARNLAVASDWIRAHLDGTELPTCEHGADLLPDCD